MPLPSWNHNWSARDAGGFKHSEIFPRYLDAWNERLAALTGTYPAWPALSPGDTVMVSAISTVAPTGHGWGDLQAALSDSAWGFVRKFNGDGSAYSPQGSCGIDSCRASVDGSGTLSWLPFPYPAGWQRKLPREIWTLSYPGASGQRARFTARITSYWWSDLTTANPATTGWGTIVNTPSGERKNSLLYFDHDGSGWQVSGDQKSDADVLSEHLVPTGPVVVGFNTASYYPGDYFGPWVLNDLRDAINQLTIVPARALIYTPTDTNQYALSFGVRGLDFTNLGATRTGTGFTVAAAQAAYNGAASPASTQTGAGAAWNEFAPGTPPYTFSANYCKPQTVNDPSGVPSGPWPNPLSQTCQLSFWGRGKVNGTAFNAYGSPALDRLWAEWAPRVSTSNVNNPYTSIGTIPAAAPGYPGDDGYQVTPGDLILLADYDVSGGFAWTSSTP